MNQEEESENDRKELKKNQLIFLEMKSIMVEIKKQVEINIENLKPNGSVQYQFRTVEAKPSEPGKNKKTSQRMWYREKVCRV